MTTNTINENRSTNCVNFSSVNMFKNINELSNADRLHMNKIIGHWTPSLSTRG